MGLVKNWRPQLKEKVVYTTPDGVSFDLHNPIPNSILSMSGWGMVRADYGITRGPYQQGYTVLTSRLAERLIKVNIRHRGCDRDQYWEKRAGLIDVLRQNRTDLNYPQPGYLRWYRSDGTIRQVDVYLSNGPDLSSLGNGWDNFSYQDTLEFIAYNPIIYNPTQLTTTLTGFTCTPQVQLVFPFLFNSSSVVFGDTLCVNEQILTINYAGQWFDYPTVLVGGPATNVRIVHNETGNIIALENYTIDTGEVVTFDLSYSRKTVQNNAGENLLRYLSDDSTIGAFSLEADPIAPGGVNTYSISVEEGTVDTYVSFKYYNRYNGI